MEQNEVLKALQRDHAAELKLAAERLKGTARHTEIIPSKVLSDMTGHEILLKPENLQVTGSFKIRGAYNKIASLSDEQLARGIVTASAGNHAQGVAYAARERGAKATICMPQITPPLKVDATKAYGADVVLYGEVFDESAARAQELSDTEGMIYVPPFDDYEVLCGQGTIGLEILEDVPNVTDVVEMCIRDRRDPDHGRTHQAREGSARIHRLPDERRKHQGLLQAAVRLYPLQRHVCGR